MRTVADRSSRRNPEPSAACPFGVPIRIGNTCRWTSRSSWLEWFLRRNVAAEAIREGYTPHSVGPTDLALSGRVPLNGSSATHRVALRKAARPPGQATARGPLQCRVGPPVQLPLVQIRVNRTIKNYYFRGALLAPLLGGGRKSAEAR